MSEIQFILEEREAYIDWANARITILEAEKASRESAIKDKDAVIAALTTRLQEAEAVIKPFAAVAENIDVNIMSKDWRDTKSYQVGFNTGVVVTVGNFRRAAAWLKGGTE